MNQTIPTAEAARLLGLWPETLRRWACGTRRGQLKPAGRVGRNLVWNARAVRKLAEEQAVHSTA